MLRTVIVISLVSVGAFSTGAAHQQGLRCESKGPLVTVPALPEGSGVALSRRSPGRLWSHNDSGGPVLVALDATGAVAGSVRVEGAGVEDWEAIAVGPCPAGSCIYVGDIGDNDARRRDITIYRVPEPDAPSGTVKGTEVFRATYPDGPHDAETMLLTPTGDLYIVTKGETGPVALYRLPRDAKSGATVRLQAVGSPRASGKSAADERITDGAVSPSGDRVALRSKRAVFLHKAADLFAGDWRSTARIPLDGLAEPQGEGVTFGGEDTIYLVGEGGGKSRPGTFARLSCKP